MPIFVVNGTANKEVQEPKEGTERFYGGWLLYFSIIVQTVMVLVWLSPINYSIFIMAMLVFSICYTTIAFFEHMKSLSATIPEILLSLSGYLATIAIDCCVFALLIADYAFVLNNKSIFNFLIVASCITLISNIVFRELGKRQFLIWMFFLTLGISTDLLLFVGLKVSGTIYSGIATPEERQQYGTLTLLADVWIFVLIYILLVTIQGRQNIKKIFVTLDVRTSIINYIIPAAIWAFSILCFLVCKATTGLGSLGYYTFIAFMGFILIFDWMIYEKNQFVLFMLLSQIIMFFLMLEVFKAV